MSSSSPIHAVSQALTKFWDSPTARTWIGVAGFVTSLVPLPGVQQVGQLVDRLAQDADMKRKMAALWDELVKVNSQLARVASLEEMIAKIAATVQHNDALQGEVQALARELTPFQASFTALAERNGLQRLINTLIEADNVSIVTQSSSRTEVNDTVIKARQTHLHTSGGSESHFNNTHFQGLGGAVGMNNMRTFGNVKIEGSSIAFGNGSGLMFMAPPQLKCGRCSAEFSAPNAPMLPGMMVRCPNCHQVSPFAG